MSLPNGGAVGSVEALTALVGSHGLVFDAADEPAIVRHGYQEGLAPDELYAVAAGIRRGLLQVWLEWERLGSDLSVDASTQRFGVLARARRAGQPGIVFANAAAIGEVDRLTDEDSRSFVGL